jgi:hypothetical protein
MDFPMATIEHCDREANQVAHELAQWAFVSKAICIWVDSPLSFIFPILSNDVTMLSDEWKFARRHFQKKNVITLIKTTAHHFFPDFASIFMHFFVSPKYYSYSIFSSHILDVNFVLH